MRWTCNLYIHIMYLYTILKYWSHHTYIKKYDTNTDTHVIEI